MDTDGSVDCSPRMRFLPYVKDGVLRYQTLGLTRDNSEDNKSKELNDFISGQGHT